MKSLKQCLVFLVAYALIFSAAPSVKAQSQNPPSKESFVAGRFIAKDYAYQGVQIAPGTNVAAGAATITLYSGSVTLPDGRKIVPFSAGGKNILGAPGAFPAIPITVGAGAAKETVTPTAVSGCFIGAPQFSCQITATFANAHGQGEVVTSGSAGIQEAINDAAFYGGGTVVVDSSANIYLGGASTVNAALLAALPFPSVNIEDVRSGAPTYYNPTANTTFLAVPATLTATTVGFGLNGANTTGGTYTGASTYHVCVSYVDLMGNEGPCSLDFSGLTAGSGTTNQIGFSAPAASAGAVGYVPYISLAGGTYALAYRVPLATYAGGGATGVSNGVCTLTTLETVIAACALANTSYNQSGSAAIVSALTVNTARLAMQLGAASTTSDIVPNSAGHTVYSYAPGVKAGGLPVGSYPPFTITTAAATTVPAVVGTITLPPGFMNVVGRQIRVCGHFSEATAGSTATISNVQFVWDADGSNTTGAGVIIGNGLVDVTTLVTANADSWSFCGTLRTTVSGAGATAGSIQSAGGWLVAQSGAAGTQASGAGGDTSVGATSSLNLAGEQRIDVEYSHTTGTDANGVVLQSMTVEVLN